MRCEEMQKLLEAYLDGELDLMRNLEIEKHLQECAPCALLHKNQQALRQAIHSAALYFSPPAELPNRLRATLRQASKAETRRSFLPWRWVMVASAMVLVAALVWFLVATRKSSTEELLMQEVIASHVRSLMADHLTDVASSDQHTVKPWFNGKLDFSPNVKDLAEQGFPLLGGRLDYLANRPVVALVYQRQKHRINLFIWPSTKETDEAEKITARQGYQVIHWTTSGMTYWIISDLNESDLYEFSRLVRT
ncbi:MAG: anti-sigma factor [Acidobacteria bacterium]|nr:anti-sigma factor [Acidobacteriota bacterium]